jgi:hypothetical protein
MANKIIYTAISGNYDKLKIHTYVNPEWDYVCFTDNPANRGKVGHWKIRPLVYTDNIPPLINRWHKIHTHSLFPEHQESIYIDGHIDILGPYLFDLVERRNQNFLVQKHFVRTCIYQEAARCAVSRKDTPKNLNRTITFLKENKMPRNYGLTENGVIYRRHHDKSVVAIMEEWWDFLSNYSIRDQIGLPYILWKHNIAIDEISFPNQRLEKHAAFSVSNHNVNNL